MKSFRSNPSRFFCMVIVVGTVLIFACYGVYQRIIRDDKERQEQSYANIILDLEKKTGSLELEVEMLRSCVRWELILVESLSLQERVELDVIEGATKTKKYKKHFQEGNKMEKVRICKQYQDEKSKLKENIIGLVKEFQAETGTVLMHLEVKFLTHNVIGRSIDRSMIIKFEIKTTIDHDEDCNK